MRIAIANWTDREVGGSSTYLATVMPRLLERGHELSFWHELNQPARHAPLRRPDGVLGWSAETLGVDSGIEALRGWRPDLVYAHGFEDPAVEARVQALAPAVFLAHGYYGTCISGGKAFKYPSTTPCTRTFGSACLWHYYPRRCGGWSPATMWNLYRRQARRLELLRGYRAVVTLSTHMAREYGQHGLEATVVMDVSSDRRSADDAVPVVREPSDAPHAHRLLFVGRIVELKGGEVLLRALPLAARILGGPIDVTFVGEGPDRPHWERVAGALSAGDSQVRVRFLGWRGTTDLATLYAQADLLVLPSLWPEPFGLVGLEAAAHRLPVVAFDVGGISDWLRHGVNGVLADGSPPTVEGLAGAIATCLNDPEMHASLRTGAGRRSGDGVFRDHVGKLESIFEQVLHAESNARLPPVDAQA